MASKKNEKPVDESAPAAAPDPMAAIRASVAPVIEANLTAIVGLDKKLTEVAGTMAARLKQATDAVVGEAPEREVTHDAIITWGMVLEHIGRSRAVHPVQARIMVDEMLAELNDLKAELNEDIQGKVNDRLKATSSGSDEMAALRAQRDELVTATKAMAVIVDGGEDGPTAARIPKAPKGTGSTTTTSGPKVTRTTGRFYRLVNGERSFYDKDTLSYMAFAHGVTTEDLKDILAKAGVDSLTKPFEVTVEIHGVKAPKKDQTTKVTIGLATDEQ